MSHNSVFIGPNQQLYNISTKSGDITRLRLLAAAEALECAQYAVSHAGFKLDAESTIRYFKYSVPGHYTLIDDTGRVAHVETRHQDGRWSANFGTQEGWVNRQLLDAIAA